MNMNIEVTYQELADHEIIRAGDEFLPIGVVGWWLPVGDSIGRTVKEQTSRDTNQAERFRRPLVEAL